MIERLEPTQPVHMFKFQQRTSDKVRQYLYTQMTNSTVIQGTIRTTELPSMMGTIIITTKTATV